MHRRNAALGARPLTQRNLVSIGSRHFTEGELTHLAEERQSATLTTTNAVHPVQDLYRRSHTYTLSAIPKRSHVRVLPKASRRSLLMAKTALSIRNSTLAALGIGITPPDSTAIPQLFQSPWKRRSTILQTVEAVQSPYRKPTVLDMNSSLLHTPLPARLISS